LLLTQEDPVVFRTTTRLVEFSIVVLDRNGKGVTNLRKEEFEVRENGKPRELAFYRFEGEPPAGPRKVTLPAGAFSNRVEFTGGPPRNVTALVLDTLNTLPQDQMWVRAQLFRYLKTLTPQTRVAIYHLGNRLNVLHDFTSDADALLARLEKAALQLPVQATDDIEPTVREAERLIAMFPDDPYLAEMLEARIENEMLYNAQVRQRKVEMTLASMESLGAHLAGIPGRKSMVWIGGGISMLSITGAMGFGPRGSIQSYEDAVRSASRRLAQHNIALYVVDARGLSGPDNLSANLSGVRPLPGRGRFERQEQAEQISADPLPAAISMAAITGGRVIRNTNDPVEGLKQAEQDLRGSYTLGFYAGGDMDGKWHGLKVRVHRPGVRVVHRDGFFAEAGGALLAEWTAAEWRGAVMNPLGSTSIALDARSERPDDAEPGRIALILQIEPRHLFFRKDGDSMVADVEIGIAEKSPTGEATFRHGGGQFKLTAGQFAAMKPSDVRYGREWKPADGTSTVRILVRDRTTGRLGTLDLPVAAIPQARSR
jgi:VWFA-related protein